MSISFAEESNDLIVKSEPKRTKRLRRGISIDSTSAIKLWKTVQKNVTIKKSEPLIRAPEPEKIGSIFMSLFYNKHTSNFEFTIIKCEIQSQASNNEFYVKLNLLLEEVVSFQHLFTK